MMGTQPVAAPAPPSLGELGAHDAARGAQHVPRVAGRAALKEADSEHGLTASEGTGSASEVSELE
eukprot:1947939-Prymnesium_polylepis.1